ncbi:MAG: class I SAM-dependent methyltransferase [Lachnospiraceae bacterium]
MLVNNRYYTGKDNYSDGDIENEIIAYLEKYGEDEYQKIFEQDTRWPVFYHITPLRRNIVNWYNFDENAELLEIGAGMGAVTNCLCERVKQVTAIELSGQRARAIELRCQDKENLELVIGNFNDIKFAKKYDYITLIGVLEYASLYTSTVNPFHDFLNKIKKLLKPGGKLLIAIENQFGMKYFCGTPEDHTGRTFDGILGYANKQGIRTFGKNELKDILGKSGFSYTKFYYPLPDYKLPNIIFSDEFMPDEENIWKYSPYLSSETEAVLYEEQTAYLDIIKNDKFDFFANSFFIEASENVFKTTIDLRNQHLIKIDSVSEKFYKNHYQVEGK